MVLDLPAGQGWVMTIWFSGFHQKSDAARHAAQAERRVAALRVVPRFGSINTPDVAFATGMSTSHADQALLGLVKLGKLTRSRQIPADGWQYRRTRP